MLRKLFGRDFDALVRKAEAAAAASDWGAAKLGYEKALAVGTADGGARAAVEAKLARAKESLAEVNLAEAELDLEAGDPAQAVDRLQTAWTLLADEARRADLEGRIAELRRRHHLQASEELPYEDLGRARPFDLEAGLQEGGALREEEHELVGLSEDESYGEALHERFELAILGMDEALAARYTALGDAFAEAYLHASEGDFEAALAGYDALDAADPIVAFERGKTLVLLDREEEAEAALRAAVDADPSWLDALLCLAEHLRAEGRPAEARAVLERAEGVAARSIERHLALAECALAEENVPQAKKCLDDAAAIDGADWRVHEGRGRCAEREGDVNEAWRHYGAAVARAPRNPALRLRLADVIARHPTEFDKALDHYNHVLRADPPDAWRVYGRIAAIYGRKGWHRQAVEVLEKALAALPDDAAEEDRRALAAELARAREAAG